MKMTKYVKAHLFEVAHPLLNHRKWLAIHYYQKHLSTEAIGKLLNISGVSVFKALKRLNIKTRSPGQKHRFDAPFTPTITKPLDLALHWKYWLAAIIDGEGCIGSVQNKSRKTPTFYCNISVGGTNHTLIKKLQQLTGLGKIFPHNGVGNRKPQWHWHVRRQGEIRRLAKTIAPYLIVKHRQANLILSLPPQNTNAPFLRRRIHKKLAKLNRKGIY